MALSPTYAQFRAVASSRGWDEEVLVDECADPATDVQALLSTGLARTRVKDKGLLAMYRLVTGPMTNVPGQASRGCKCGCGAKLRGKQQFATSACQRRVHRQKVARNS
jgi:hypothetical protein